MDGLLASKLLARECSKAPKAIQPTPVALGEPTELNGKTLLMKTPHFYV